MLSPWRAGFALGVLVGFMHLLWSVLVAFGAAQALVDLVLKLHFLEVSVRIAPFDPGLAAILIVVTGLIGCLMGSIFAGIWNWTRGKRS